MTAQEIIQKIEAGEYEIKYAMNCGCSFDWHIDGDDIQDGANSDECWEGQVLYVGEDQIAESIRYEGRRVLMDGIDADDIPSEVWDQMGMSDMVTQGDSPNNQDHEDNRRATLIDWLQELVNDGYKLYRDDLRNFANEFCSILVRPDTEDAIDDDWTERTPEGWAGDYLYNGDAATQAYNTVRVI